MEEWEFHLLDVKIKKIEQELNELRQIIKKYTQNKDLSELPVDLILQSYDNDEQKCFNNFNELFEYLKKVWKDDYVVALDYCEDSRFWKNKDFALTDVNEILQTLSLLNAIQLKSMDFGVCTKKEKWIYQILINTEFMKKLEYMCVSEVKKEDYEHFMEEARKYHIF